jgi:SAM-dependent methyltransferase
MNFGERQVAPTRDGIRRDHVARYEFVLRELGSAPQRVLDVACGVGYGTQLLAEHGHTATGVDIDDEAIAYAKQHYSHDNAWFLNADMNTLSPTLVAGHDVAVAFECIEHVERPEIMLRALRANGVKRLFASVPNEDEFPHGGNIEFHHRHYTPDEFRSLLASCGWSVDMEHSQSGPFSAVGRGAGGRTIIAICSPAESATVKLPEPAEKTRKLRTVAILGLGPSLESYVDLAKRLGNRNRLADEVWGINAVGSVLHCDLVFHMDDARVQDSRADRAPESNIAAMMEWMRDYNGRVLTSVPHPEYPCMEAYPLQNVVQSLDGFAYFNSTAAYAVAYAIHMGFEKILMFGCDFTYENSHHAEKGRACVEFWLGFAAARGIKIASSKLSSLLDACEPIKQRLYGYDGATVRIDGEGRNTVVRIEPHDDLPSAAEVEEAYDHSRHANPLVRAEQEAA